MVIIAMVIMVVIILMMMTITTKKVVVVMRMITFMIHNQHHPVTDITAIIIFIISDIPKLSSFSAVHFLTQLSSPSLFVSLFSIYYLFSIASSKLEERRINNKVTSV